ncbi:MAG: hypothetical protein M1816_007285 [Peltula sp. TS41687]|nr:MAG: hypothetical protein M1816_007285 [Peltula sp. TS41687]
MAQVKVIKVEDIKWGKTTTRQFKTLLKLTDPTYGHLREYLSAYKTYRDQEEEARDRARAELFRTIRPTLGKSLTEDQLNDILVRDIITDYLFQIVLKRRVKETQEPTDPAGEPESALGGFTYDPVRDP